MSLKVEPYTGNRKQYNKRSKEHKYSVGLFPVAKKRKSSNFHDGRKWGYLRRNNANFHQLWRFQLKLEEKQWK